MKQKETQFSQEIKPTIQENYELQSIVGTGTFGKVYLAKQKQTKRIVALKNVMQNKRYKNRQLQILKSVNHPGIVSLYNYFYEEKKDGVYLNLVMEFIPQTLSKLLKSKLKYKQFIDCKVVKKYVFYLLSALAYLNERNIAHRDIKPSNILINQYGQAKICDFGSAKILSEGQKNLAYICSRYYRAPQLIFGATQYSTKLDIWSLGCVICEMYTNIPIFEGTNNMNQLVKIMKVIGSPTQQDLKAMRIQKNQTQIMQVQGTGIQNRIKKVNENISPDMLNLISKMLVYNPQKRISAKEALSLKMFEQFTLQITK